MGNHEEFDDYELRISTWNDPADEVKAVRRVKTPKSAKSGRSVAGRSIASRATSINAAGTDSFLSRPPTPTSNDQWGKDLEPRARASGTNTADVTVSGRSTTSFYTSQEKPHTRAIKIGGIADSIHSNSSYRTFNDRPQTRASNATDADSGPSTLSVHTSYDTLQNRAPVRCFYGSSNGEQPTLSLNTTNERAPAGSSIRNAVFNPAISRSVNNSQVGNRPNYFNYRDALVPSTFDDVVDKYKRDGPTVPRNQPRYLSGPQKPRNGANGRRAYTPSASSFKSQNHSRSGSFQHDSEWGASSRSFYNNPNLYLSDPDMLGLGPDGYEGPEGFLRDNDADRAERAGFEPDAYFSLPLQRHRTFDERFFGPRNTNLRHIAVKTNTHLSMPARVDDPNIQIWGSEDDVLLAKRDLLALMDHINADIQENIVRFGGTWAKVNAFPSARKLAYLERLAQESALRRKFRKLPPEGEEFRAVGVFLWPTKEINPQFCLGMNFEALDNIRFHCEVYILFSRKSNMFRILGQDPGKVNEAVNRVFGAFCEIASKNRKANKRFLVHPPSTQLPGTGVRIVKKHILEGRQITLKHAPRGIGIQVFLTGAAPTQAYLREWQFKREQIRAANYRYLKEVFQEGLKDIYYYRGYSTLKVHFGTLLIFGYKKPQGGLFDLMDFCNMMGNSQTSGEVVRYVGEEYVARAIIGECDSRTDLFSPAESKAQNLIDVYGRNSVHNGPMQSLPAVKAEPTYFATFEIKMYDDTGQTNDIRLEVKFELILGDHPSDMTNEVGEVWKVGTRRWLHVRNNPTGGDRSRSTFSQHKGPVDVKVFDLERDITCQIELVTYDYYKDTDVYPIFSEFVRKVSLEEIPDETDPVGPPTQRNPDLRRTVKRVKYVNLPGMSVETVIMKTKYRYWINGTPYVLETTKYEHFDTQHVNQLYPDGIAISWKGFRTNHDTRWGCCLINADVNETFSKQKGLDIGCVSDWDPDVVSVFKSSGTGGFEHPAWTRDNSLRGAERPDPWQGDGFREMIYRIEECARFIARIRDDILAKELGVEDIDENVNVDADEMLECLDLADI